MVSMLGLTTANAQQKVPKKTKAKTSVTMAKDSAASKKTAMKKDGTPDMRYKQNKTKTKTVTKGPTKKDGTADMRYKANKDKAKSK